MKGHEQEGESDDTLPGHKDSGASDRSVTKPPDDPSTRGDDKGEQPDLSDARSNRVTGTRKDPQPNSAGGQGSQEESLPHKAEGAHALAPQAEPEEQPRHGEAGTSQEGPLAKKLRRSRGPPLLEDYDVLAPRAWGMINDLQQDTQLDLLRPL